MAISRCSLRFTLSLLWISLITGQNNTNSTQSSSTQTPIQPPLPNYCVGPLVPSPHKNPISEKGGLLTGCGLSCASGGSIYGLTEKEQSAVDYFTVIGSTLCFIGLLVLSYNLYEDLKESKEKFHQRPLLFHIPYIITFSTYLLTLTMSISAIIGKESVVCNGDEFSLWNPGDGKNINCTIMSIFFYSPLLIYEFYVLLLTFILWRQFKNPMRPLWDIRERYWHGSIFCIVLILNIAGLATSSVDPIEPMGVCMPGPADRGGLFGFVVFPLLFCSVLSTVFLIWSLALVKSRIDQHKDCVNKIATNNMADLFKRMMWYGFGVLFTLALLTVTAFKFYVKHDTLREAQTNWIQCELTNYFTPDEYGLDQDCDALRTDDQSIAPFYFISWVIACLIAIIAQLILSFHSKARDRVKLIKQKTTDMLNSPKSKSKSSKIDLAAMSSGNESPITTTNTNTNTGTGTRLSGFNIGAPALGDQDDKQKDYMMAATSPQSLEAVASNSVDVEKNDDEMP